jgi:hypothetical protein
VAAALFAGGASASTIYTNGPANGNVQAYTINFGWQVADSFTAASGSTATSMSFETWAADSLSTDVPQTVDWEITNGNPLSGGAFTVVDSGTATAITATALGTNVRDVELFSDSISLPNVALTCSSNCWISLDNGVTADGQPMYWDGNNGPSDAWQNNDIGDLSTGCADNFSGGGSCSETFTIFGTLASGTPEPATWALMLTGFAGLGAALRARRKLAAA